MYTSGIPCEVRTLIITVASGTYFFVFLFLFICNVHVQCTNFVNALFPPVVNLFKERKYKDFIKNIPPMIQSLVFFMSDEYLSC